MAIGAISLSGQLEAYTSPYPPEWEFGILKHRPRDPLENIGKEFAPDTIPLQDVPNGDNKGAPINIDRWWSFIQSINNADGYKFARSVNMMWINGPYGTEENPYPLAEAISCGGAFIAYDKRTASHLHMFALDYRYPLTDKNVNWHTCPYAFFKAVMINKDGTLRNVADGVDCYLPNLFVTDRWINAQDVELFPELPVNVYTNDMGWLSITKYILRGASVIGEAARGEKIYLRKATKAGEFIQATSWQLQTAGPVPPP